MTLVGRIRLGSQPGQGSLSDVPDMVLTLEDIRSVRDGLWRVIFWASGDDFETYENALDADSTVEHLQRLTDLRDRRLYTMTIAEAVQGDVLHPIAIEHDITIVELTMTAERATLLARFPSREALVALRTACRERDMEFRLERLYEEEATANDGGVESRYGITSAQREVLLAALESGYFDVPRRTTLEAVAEELDVSTAAVSTRLRRGQRNLLRTTLASDSAT